MKVSVALSASMFVLFFCLASLEKARATITVVGTGERFSSYPDRTIGIPLKEKGGYMARLQRLPDNMDMCEPDAGLKKNYSVTVPSDGTYVALVARGGRCSDVSKARLASFNIDPPGVVKYLIIYNNGVSIFDGDTLESVAPEEKEPKNSMSELDRHHHGSKPGPYNAEISVSVLHVSQLSGHELFQIILSEDDDVRQMGGPRIYIDSKDALNNKFLRRCLFWVGLSLMMSGCLCSFMLSMRVQEIMGAQNETAGQANVRTPRPRLTQEQVEEWLPVRDYDEEDGARGLAECTICFDEFEIGDKIRSLPCKHIYHCDCVQRWLTERSSTCPLCKLDLLEGESEDEGEDDESEIAEEEYAPFREADDDGLVAGDNSRTRSPFSVVRFFSNAVQRLRRRTGHDPITNPIILEGEMVSQQPLLGDVGNEENTEEGEVRGEAETQEGYSGDTLDR